MLIDLIKQTEIQWHLDVDLEALDRDELQNLVDEQGLLD